MQSDILASWARSSAICSRDTCVAGDSDVWWPRKGAYDMHCSLAFGSIGARAKLVGMPSHHHAAAIAPRDIRKSISGMWRETSSVLLAGMIRWASSMREAGRLKNHLLTIEDAIT